MEDHIKKRLLPFLCFVLVLSLRAVPDAAAQKAGGGAAGTCWIIPVRGDIEPSLVTFVRREARKALAQGVESIIFEIDTFGGRVDSALQITSFITSL
ncbi:MAG: hypothetical protein LBP32_09100, partial [Spirochaetaceae bacterium]|nr:hypothetical protein [Spirochaetaceae bacterium]